MTVTSPVTFLSFGGVLVYGEILQLTLLTCLDLMRTDGSLSAEWHIKMFCIGSSIEFYAKSVLTFTPWFR